MNTIQLKFYTTTKHYLNDKASITAISAFSDDCITLTFADEELLCYHLLHIDSYIFGYATLDIPVLEMS